MPTRYQVENWRADQLKTDADRWHEQAALIEMTFGLGPQVVANAPWTGGAADQSVDQMSGDLADVRAILDKLRQAEQTARDGATQLTALKTDAVQAIHEAEGHAFKVNNNLTLEDLLAGIPGAFSAPLLALREVQRQADQADIQAKALKLAAKDEDIATKLRAIAAALQEFSFDNPSGEPLGGPGELPNLSPGQIVNFGPLAGTDAPDAIPGIKAADLGEIIKLPNGSYVAIFGDSYAEPRVGGNGNPHYSSVAVPVTFDKDGKPHYGPPLTGTTLNPGADNERPGPNTLFPMPPEAIAAGANNTLPAGSIKVGKDTYMMVVGTNTKEGLTPKCSWMVKVTDDPSKGWPMAPGSYRNCDLIPNPDHSEGQPPFISDPAKPPTQISGYQGSDGKVYIAADGFDRHQGVSMYRVDPADIANRDKWEPYNPADHTWGPAGQVATNPITPPEQRWAELSFREIDGKPVLAGTNMHNTDPGGGQSAIEVHVGDTPTEVADQSKPKIVVMSNDSQSPNFVPAPYGGYIMPDSSLRDLGIVGSQWHPPPGARTTDDNGNPIPLEYGVRGYRVNATPGPH